MATFKEVMTVIECPEAHTAVVSSFRVGKLNSNDQNTPSTRPLILTFESNHIKTKILNNARKLANSKFNHISLQPDLTHNQRQREQELWGEAELLNSELSAEEAKNWVWRPWGRPGIKRLRKMKLNPEDSQRGNRKRPRNDTSPVTGTQQKQRKKRGGQ